MKKLLFLFALVAGLTGAKAQSNVGNDLYKGLTEKLPYGRMVTPYGVQVT